MANNPFAACRCPSLTIPASSSPLPFKRARSASTMAVVIALLAAAPVVYAETVKIALIEGLSGAFAPVGHHNLKEFEYLAELTNSKSWAGKDIKLEIIAFDGKASPQESLTQLKSVTDQKVRYVLQGPSSAVSLALSDAISKHNERNSGNEIVYLNFAGGDPALTNERRSFWHFRVDSNTDQKVEALTTFMKGDKNIRSVYLVNQNYSYGHAFVKASKEMMGRKRPDTEIVGDDLHPLGQVKDFSPYIAKIKQSGADTVLTGNWGADLSLLIKAAKEANLGANFYTLYGGLTGVPTAVGASGEDKLRQLVAWSPNEKTFNGQDLYEDFKSKYQEDFLGFGTYPAIKLLSEGIKKARTTDPVKVAHAMHGLKFQSINGEVEMRAEDHQLQQSLAILSWQKKDGDMVKYDAEKTGYGWRTESVLPASASVLPSTCKMTIPG